jgi:DNA-binding NarL/FixJ family response regulator
MLSVKTAVKIPPARILIADDAAEVAQRMAALFTPLEQLKVVGPADNGGEALKLYHAHKPEVALLDLNMPVHSGLEVLRAIRQTDDSCLVCIVSTNLDEEVRDACIKAGADHCLNKHGEFERLPEIVLTYLGLV